MAKRYYEGNYVGMDQRRAQESEDAAMIKEDHSACANLPQNVMIKDWPVAPSRYMPEDLDDKISGINKQINSLDNGKRDAKLNPKKV